MRWPERRLRRPLALAGVLLCLYLVLAPGASRASAVAMQEAQSMAPAVVASTPMRQMLDCMPCVGCYAAPAPVGQGVSGEPGDVDGLAWQARDPALPRSMWSTDAGGWRAQLPLRIAFCRWLD